MDLKQLRKASGLTQDALAKKLGVDRRTIINYEKGEFIPESKIKLINMLLSENISHIESKETLTGYYYPNVYAAAGMDKEMQNDELKRLPINLPNWEKGIDFINVYGDSMYPKFCSGEIIGIKEVEPKYLNFGYAYVIIFNDGQVLLKFIRKGKDDDHWLLASENPKYEDVKRIHIKTILEKIKEQRNSSNNSYNKYLTHFGAILSELIQYDIIENNPADKIKHLPIEDSILHNPASINDIKKIKYELKKKDINFYNFVSVIFHLGIRPEEILQIKVSMINFEDEIITLLPKNTKSRKKYRILPVNKYLMRYFNEMKLDQAPKDFFLFGSFRDSGKGNAGPKIDFIPGPTQLKRDTATKRWERIVKKGLGINMTMYAMKKHGANMKLSSGISLEAISEQFGHSKVETTKIYTTKLNEINRSEVLLKSPAF